VHQAENIKLDPELQAACKEDVSKHCAKVKAGNAAVSFAQFKCAHLVIRMTKDQFNLPSHSWGMYREIGHVSWLMCIVHFRENNNFCRFQGI